MTFIWGRRIWSFWACAAAASALGMVLAALVVSRFPGPPVGQILLFAGVPVTLVVASRLSVRFGPEGLAVPRIVGRTCLPVSQIAGLRVVATQVQTVPPVPVLIPRLELVDGSSRDLRLLAGYDFVPGARAAFTRSMDILASTLGVPLKP